MVDDPRPILRQEHIQSDIVFVRSQCLQVSDTQRLDAVHSNIADGGEVHVDAGVQDQHVHN